MRESAEHAEGGLGKLQEKGSEHLEKLRESFKDVAKVAAGFVAGNVLMGATKDIGSQFEEIIGQTSAWGEQVRVLSQNMGISAEDASTLALAMKDVGISGEAGDKALTKFTKGLHASKDVVDELGQTLEDSDSIGNTVQGLENMGIAAVNVDKSWRPMMDIFGDVSDKFHEMPDGIGKTGLATQLFGKTGADLIPLLNLGREGLKEVEAEAKKYGLQLTAGNVQDIRKFALAHNEMNAATEGTRLQIGLFLIPIMTKLAGLLSEGLVRIREWINEFKESDVFETITIVLAGVGDAIGSIVNMVKALMANDPNSFFLAIREGAAALGLDIDGLQDTFLGITAFLFGTVPQAFEKVKAKLDEFREAIQPAIDQLTNFLSVKDILLAVAAVVGGVLVGAFVAWAAAAVSAAAGTVIALAPVLIPIALIVAAIALLRAAWVNNWGDIQGKVGAVVAFVMPIFQAIGTELSKFWTDIQPKLAAAWDAISGKVTEIWHHIWDEILQPGIAKLVDFWQSNWDNIQAILQAVWRIISDQIQIYWDIISGIFKVAMDLLSGNWSGAWEDIKKTVTSVFDHIKDIFAGALPEIASKIVSIAGSVISGIGGAVHDADLPGVVNGLVESAKTAAGNVGWAIIHGIAEGLRAGWDWLRDQGANLARAVLNSAKGALGIHSPSAAFAEVGHQMLEGVKVGLNSNISSLQNVTSNHFSSLTTTALIPAALDGSRQPRFDSSRGGLSVTVDLRDAVIYGVQDLNERISSAVKIGAERGRFDGVFVRP